MYVVISVMVLYCDIWYLSQGPERVRNERLMVMATCQGVRVTKMDVTNKLNQLFTYRMTQRVNILLIKNERLLIGSVG